MSHTTWTAYDDHGEHIVTRIVTHENDFDAFRYMRARVLGAQELDAELAYAAWVHFELAIGSDDIPVQRDWYRVCDGYVQPTSEPDLASEAINATLICGIENYLRSQV